MKVTKGLLMTALITGSVVWGGTAVFAEELQEYTLDQMVVTATRTEKRDVEIPAIVEVYDEKKIEDTGAANAFDVLQNTLGIMTQSQGFNGTSMGTMTSKVMIRGVEKGTLVLVNGVPMNLDGKYNLDDIPTESIEKIEVVKGGGSVLYGSDASGGVINIITKKKVQNKVSVAAGNYGKERYNVSVGADKFSIIAGLENRGKAEKMSGVSATGGTTIYDYGKGERKSVLWNYNINDALTFTHNYSNNQNQYLQKNAKNNKLTKTNDYEDTDNMFLLNYDKDGWKAKLSYGTQEKEYDVTDVGAAKYRYSWRKGHSTNVDIQKNFELGKNSFLIGASYQKEDIDLYSAYKKKSMGNPAVPENNSTLKRDIYSLYASYNMNFDEKSNLILNARETFTNGTEGTQTFTESGKTTRTENDNLSKFTPEAEYIYKFNDDRSAYAKVGKSFRLPNLTQLYGTGLINSTLNLKPEQGTHYEIGYKENIGKASWKAALFNYEIKDAIDADTQYDNKGQIVSVDYVNQNVRNTGIELSLNMNHDDNWSTNWGLMFHNPQAQNKSAYGDNEWHDTYGKYQLQGTVNYKKDKFTSMLAANFVGDRTSTRTTLKTPQRHLKPQLFTDLHFTYSPEKNQKAFLHINNILDRIDITSNSTANFYSLGRNFMVGYEYSF